MSVRKREFILGIIFVLILSLRASAYEFPPGLVAWLHTRHDDAKMLNVNMTSDGQMSFDQWGIKFRILSPGLTQDQDAVSFEALDHPGYFLKYSIVINETSPVALTSRDDDIDLQVFRQQSTFAIRRDKSLKSWYTFETMYPRGLYISRSLEDELMLIEDNPSYVETLDSRIWRLVEDLFATIGFTKGEYGRFDIIERNADTLEIGALVSPGHSFRFRSPGLTGEVGTTSMESLRYPGFFIRHRDDKVYLQSVSSPLQGHIFYRDATFSVDHLKTFGRLRKDFMTLQSVNLRGHYLTSSATGMVEVSATLPNRGRQLIKVNEIAMVAESDITMGWGYVKQDRNIFAIVLQRGVEPRFRALTPGLSAQPGSISFESLKHPGYFVRHHKSNVFLENSVNPRGKNLYDEDATFYIDRHVWVPGCFTLKPMNDVNKFVISHNQHLKISPYDGTRAFQENSCFFLQ